jgi:large subunit ribosomal protein L4
MDLHCFRSDGEKVGMRSIPLPRFDGDAGLSTFHRVVVAYQRNARQGDAQAKTRAEVSGSGKKPYRQKGTGNARHGEKRSPIWTGGGVTFGPRKRDYGIKINRRVRLLALARGLVHLATEGALCLVESFAAPDRPRTKDFLQALRRIQGDGRCVLLVDEPFEETTVLSARNLPQVLLSRACTLNAWDVACCSRLLVTERAMAVLLTRMAVLDHAKEGVPPND